MRNAILFVTYSCDTSKYIICFFRIFYELIILCLESREFVAVVLKYTHFFFIKGKFIL